MSQDREQWRRKTVEWSSAVANRHRRWSTSEWVNAVFQEPHPGSALWALSLPCPAMKRYFCPVVSSLWEWVPLQFQSSDAFSLSWWSGIFCCCTKSVELSSFNIRILWRQIWTLRIVYFRWRLPKRRVVCLSSSTCFKPQVLIVCRSCSLRVLDFCSVC